jgi:predicted DNA binding CopG/RHH family protein
MQKTVKRIRIPEKVIDHYRKKYEGLSFQKFVEIALDNQVLRDCHQKTKIPF